jgi:ABC-type dipeptide/oligopeptide/nickel transport system permease subunit
VIVTALCKKRKAQPALVPVGPRRQARRQILPTALALTVVGASYSVANVIPIEALLSFLGPGVEPSIPSRGSTVAVEGAWIRSGSS